MGKWLGLALVFVAGIAVSAVASAADTKLTGIVGPGFSISLVDAQGQPVTKLPVGEVDLTVDDRSSEHNFHLRGPGVDVTTGVEEIGQRIFTVTLRDGIYTFVCDPHASTMAGSFEAGTAPTPPPTTTAPPRPAASAPVGATLESQRRARLHDLAQDPCRPEGQRASAGQLHGDRARPVGRAQRAPERRRRREGDRGRLRGDEDVACHAAERHARHPVRSAQGEHAHDRSSRVAEVSD